MGHSIVYCDKCGLLLKEEDFRQGKAFTSDNRSYCAGCRPTGSSPRLPTLPGTKASSTRIPKQPAHESVTSTRIPKQPHIESRRLQALPPAPPPPAQPPASTSKMIWIGVGGAAIVIVGLAVMFSGSKAAPKPPEETTNTTTTRTVVTVPQPPVENLNPEERRREEAARAACVKAYDVQTTRPRDLAGQWRAFEAAVAAAQGTSYLGDATTQLGKLRRKLEEERAEIEKKAQEALTRENYKGAVEVWEAELKRYDLQEWTRPVGDRVAELKADFERRLGIMREAAVEARKRGDEPEAKRVRARVAGWGLVGYPEQIDQALVGIVPDKPATPPENPGTPKAIDAYRARWKDLVGPVAGRDFAEAVKVLEKIGAENKDEAVKKEAADDLENLKLAASLVSEAAAMLPKMAKGQRLAFSYWDPAGNLAKIEDVVLKVDATRVEMKWGDGSIVVPFGEIAASTLADLFKTRAAKKDSDNRAATTACLLDGDPEGAQRFRGEAFPSINDKYAEAAKDVLQRRSGDDREKAARQLFTEAERDYFDYGEMVGAVAKYKALLGGDHAATSFVRRNRAAIIARTEGGMKDFLYASGDLNVTTGFKLGKYGKIESAWVSTADADPAKTKDNYVELSFSAAPEVEYRCWILAGGCCQEVFTFHYQGTELTGPDPANPREKIAAEPGSAGWITVKSTNSSLKKLHSQHTGPKNPERFDWIPVGVFKYPTAGVKVIRILTNQKGFAVSAAGVMTTRPGAPRDLDFKEFEKWKAETPGAALKQGGIVTGSILREVWKDIGGGGIGDLINQPAFKEDRPTERGLIANFEGPTDWADNYGTRIRGYVHPPATGAYVFWISSDDQGELWLSTDEDPKNKTRIGFVPDFTAPREFTKHASQMSKPIDLKAGRRYYIEALQKEGGGGDNLCVKWKLPSGQEEAPIPGIRLSAFVPPKK